MKGILLLTVFLLCAGIGIVYVLDLQARRRQIAQMLELIRFFRREIRCSFVPIPELLSRNTVDLPLLRTIDHKTPFDLVASYQKAKTHSRSEMFFTEQDWNAVDALFSSLGQGDEAEQTEYLNACEAYFLQAEAESRELLYKKGRPALVLGGSAGAVLVLILL